MADFSDFPDGLKVSSNDSAGEISASVDETNRFASAHVYVALSAVD